MQTWGWIIIIYLFLGGLGAGSFMAAYAASIGLIKAGGGFIRAGFLLSAPCIIIGCALLYFDLGVAFSDPLAVLNMFSNTASVMTWGIYILTLFLIIGAVAWLLAYKGRSVPMILRVTGAFLGLCTAGYTGLLLMVSQGVPFWNTAMLPILFIISAISTGIAANSLLARFLSDEKASSHKAIVIAELVALGAFLFISVNSMAKPAQMSATSLIWGSFAPAFWLLCIGLGIAFPLFSAIRQKFTLASESGILLAGLSLRAIVVFAALPAWSL